MSRSIHKTIKGVLGGKSAKDMKQMIEESDPDVEELGRKYFYKNSERDKRKLNKQTKKMETTNRYLP